MTSGHGLGVPGRVRWWLDRDRYGQEIAAARIAKEKLRDTLNLRARITGSTPCEREVRSRLFLFYDWCAQHNDIPELVSLAKTISRWDDEITAAVVTGMDERHRREPEPARQARAPPRLRVPQPPESAAPGRITCTRGYRRRSYTATPGGHIR